MIERGSFVGDRWEVLEPIGTGGMGDVYRARHRLTQRSSRDRSGFDTPLMGSRVSKSCYGTEPVPIPA